MRVAMIGAGAMGCLFGARLALAGAEVRMIDVDRATLDAIRRDGVHLSDDDGDRRIAMPAGVAADFKDAVDLMILFTKGQHSATALAAARHLLRPGSWVMTLQNGLGAGERVRATLPGTPVAIGMTDWPADLRAPGSVASHGRGSIRLWSLAGKADPMLETIVALLARAGLNARCDPQVEVAIWEKVIFNSAMNPVAALTRLTVGGMAGSADGPALCGSIVDEGLAIAAAAGIAVDPERVRAAVAHAYADHGSHKPSMLKDLLAGRATEIDSINGALADRARQHDVRAPINESLARLVRMATAAR